MKDREGERWGVKEREGESGKERGEGEREGGGGERNRTIERER